MIPLKQLLLDEIKELIDTSNALIVAKYDRLTPQKTWDFSQSLKQSKSKFKIVKKRIFNKALLEKKLDFSLDKVQGHVGILFIEGDSLEATKSIVDFQKENEELFKIIIGQIEGKICSSAEIKVLATMPSKDDIRAQLLGLFESPMSQTLAVMEGLLTSVMHCLENKIKK